MEPTAKVLANRKPRPVTMVIMDGVGRREATEGNAVADAFTPHLDWLLEHQRAPKEE